MDFKQDIPSQYSVQIYAFPPEESATKKTVYGYQITCHEYLKTDDENETTISTVFPRSGSYETRSEARQAALEAIKEDLND